MNLTVSLICIFGFSGCVQQSFNAGYLSTGSQCENSGGNYFWSNDKKDWLCSKDVETEVQNEAKRLGITVTEYKNRQFKEKQRIEEEKQRIEEAKQKAFLNKIAQYEIDYLHEYEKIKKQIPDLKIAWVQPKNKKESCKVYVDYYDKNPTEDTSYKLFWDGECKDGYAYGLGREIEKANLTDRWQVGIYEKGMATSGFIQKDNLHNVLVEGEANYGGSKYAVVRRVFEENRDTNLVYESGSSGSKNEPALMVAISPFWNQTQVYRKVYPNFRYEFADFKNNDEAQHDTQFGILNNTNQKHGWAIEKMKGRTDYLKGEYINDVGSIVNLPNEYINKAEQIVNEIKQASNRALYAQNQSQLVKKQYLRKICKESIKVDFMDNEEYKEICEDKAEKELMAKIDTKLQKITQERIAKLEQQRYTAQQQKEEQYRQQQFNLERQKVDAQQRQAKAAQDAADAASTQNLNQTFQNINQNLQMQQLNNNLMLRRYGY